MAIIEDYDAISRRLNELLTTSPKGVNDIADLERWRDLARETAQEYVENRRREAVTGQRFERPRADPSTGRPPSAGVAYAILFLASDESSDIPGSRIRVEGGTLAIEAAAAGSIVEQNRRRPWLFLKREPAGVSGRVVPTSKAQELSAWTRLHSKPICDGKGTKSSMAGCGRAR